MDNLRCNRLTCRRALTDKAVVEGSHVFCIDCANELFNASRLCPACETSLTEPDDVVVSSLHPSNDYKTSVLSGLNPATTLEICSRALSFWQYQMHQEYSFQQALYRNVTEKHAQMEKRLENVIREANGEISLLTGKMNELERDLDGERRKTANLQDSLKESEKEYHKLKAQYDKLKRKALLGGATVGGGKDGALQIGNQTLNIPDRHDDAARLKQGMAFNSGNGVRMDVGAVVGNMEAAGIQRTPIVNRTMNGVPLGTQSGSGWRQPQPASTHTRGRQPAQRQPFTTMDGSFRTSVSTTRSDHSDSTAEVENLLAQTGVARARHGNHRDSGFAGAMQRGPSASTQSRAFGQSSSKRAGPKFKPASVPMG